MLKANLMITAASLALLAGAPVDARQIGSVAAVNKAVEGTPPEAEARKLKIGEGVVQNELIESSPIGSGQFIFLDQTTLTIARDSALVLDKYVYDPDTKTGEVAISMSKGVLRFIGGRITKNTEATIVTPTATIGIRGGMAVITINPDGSTTVMHIAGKYSRMETRTGEKLTISRSNGLGRISADGREVRYVGVADRDFVTEVSRLLIGRGQAGQTVRPTDPDVIASGIAVANSEAEGASAKKPVSTTGEAEEDEETGLGIETLPNEEEVQTNIAFEALPDPVPPTPPTPPTPPAPPESLTLLPGVTGSAALSTLGVPGLTSGDGANFIFTQVFEGSRVGRTAEGDEFSVPTDAAGFFSFGLGGGDSPLGPLSGSGFFDPDAEFTYAAVQTEGGAATGYFLAGAPSDPLPDAAAGAVTARNYQVSSDLLFGGAPFLPAALSGFGAEGATRLTLISGTGGPAAGGDAALLYGFLEINGEGPGQTTGFGVLTGQVGAAESGTPAFASFFQGLFTDGAGGASFVTSAVATTDDGQGATAFGPGAQYLAFGNEGDFGRGTETLASSAVDQSGASTAFGNSGVGALLDTASLPTDARGQLGATSLSGFAAISGVDSGGFAARNRAPANASLTLSPTTNSATADFTLTEIIGAASDGGLDSLSASFGGVGSGAYLSDQSFAMRGAAGPNGAINGEAAAFSGALATAGLVGDGGVFPDGVDTAPEFLTWGWWAGGLEGGEDALAALSEQNLHLGAWVGGDLTAMASLPLRGVATYQGFAAVSGVEGGRAFVDGAGFDMTYDFADGGLGTVAFTGLLGDNPVIAVRGGGAANYTGVAGINANGRAGLVAVDGAFFNARGTAAGATAGGVSVRSNDRALSATGVFGGDRKSFTGGGS